MITDLADPTVSLSIPAPLRELGVGPGTLSPLQAANIERDGYLLLPGHLAVDELAKLREVHDRLMREKYGDAPANGPATGDFWFHEPGTRRLNDLLSEGEVFERMTLDPLLLAATWLLMRRPFKHDSINAREAQPGHGGQGMHRDDARPADGHTLCVNSAWLLDPFTPDNGPTRVVPGSHQWVDGPDRGMPDPTAPHPDEIRIIAPAGSVFIFSGSLWHSGTINRSTERRRVIHASFRRRDIDLGWRAQRLRIRKATWDRLSPAARWLVEV